MRKIVVSALAMTVAAVAVSGGVFAAGRNSVAQKKEAVEEITTEAAEEDEQGAGFQEFPIWEDEELGFMNINGVYFQPVPMSNGNENYEDYDLHFEADIAAMENDLGYGLGDWVPYLTVDFEIIGSDGEVAAEGTFMPMSASDGPHYGANIKLPEADTYSVKITIHSPEENGYLIHLDGATGPGGTLDEYWGDGPLVLELEDVWDYAPQEW